jgi:1,4-dihydroxy-2-naphthoate octaprenyltransferase
MEQAAADAPRWRVWLMAARPRTLPAAVSPVLVGMALAAADGKLNALPSLAALAGALLIQVGANLANDYYDFVQGTDAAGRKGPLRVAQSGLIPLPQLRLGIALTFGLATLVGLYLVWVGGWPILILGLASILSALAYTAGPYPLGYHGLGDLFVFLFFGLGAVCGTYYLQALTVTPGVVVAAIPVGALTVAILVVNNLRDIDTDRQGGKRTLAVLLGETGSRLEYALLLVLAYAVPLLMWLSGATSPWVLISWLTLPLSVRLLRTIYSGTEGPRLNMTLAATANLDLAFSLLFALGLVL